MSTSLRIDRPRVEADRPRVLLVTTVGGLLFVVGVLVARASLDRDAPPPANSTGSEAPAVAAAPPSPEPAPRSPKQASKAVAPAPAEDRPSPALPAGGRLGMERGRVAYVRCDGIRPKKTGAFPCPRDTNLEERVWAALDRLPRCGGASLGEGEGDLRFTFSRGTLEKLRLRSEDEAFPSDDLLACVRRELGAVRTPLRADPLIVSFRFHLRGRVP